MSLRVDKSCNRFNLAEKCLNGLDAQQCFSASKQVYLFEKNRISRGELEKSVKILATNLEGSGVKAGDRVLLLLNDTPALPTLFLACCAMGAVPVALNPKLKTESLRPILKESESSFLAVELSNISLVQDLITPNNKESTHAQDDLKVLVQDLYGGNVLSLDAQFKSHHSILSYEVLSSELAESLAVTGFSYCYQHESEVAFWQYTSGTTGNPKAVMHIGKSMVCSAERFARDTIGLSCDDIIYSVAKMFFGYGMGNSLFFPLLLGCRAILDGDWPTPEKVVKNIEQYRPTILFAGAAIYSALLKEQIESTLFSSIKLCFSAGSPLPVGLYRNWNSVYGSKILDGIGATEVGHVFITNSFCMTREGATGVPVSGYDVEIRADSTGKLSDKGVLWVTGPSIAKGYWKNRETTESRFVDGWYCTGDVFSKDGDGFYYYHGRQDDLFKVKGRWVEPAEIESLISDKFPQVLEAVVVPSEDEAGLTWPALFVVSHLDKSNQSELSQTISHYLKSNVENHKVPRNIQFINQLPRNENGKIVRSILSGLHSGDKPRVDKECVA